MGASGKLIPFNERPPYAAWDFNVDADLQGEEKSTREQLQLTQGEWLLIHLARDQGHWYLVDRWDRAINGSMSAIAMYLRRRGLDVVVRKMEDGQSVAYARMVKT